MKRFKEWRDAQRFRVLATTDQASPWKDVLGGHSKLAGLADALLRGREEHLRPRDKIGDKVSDEYIRSIGRALDIDWNEVSFKEFKAGLYVELEHGRHNPDLNVTNDNFITTGKIALAHLRELPDYYTRLRKMEKEGKKKLKEDAPANAVGNVQGLQTEPVIRKKRQAKFVRRNSSPTTLFHKNINTDDYSRN